MRVLALMSVVKRSIERVMFTVVKKLAVLLVLMLAACSSSESGEQEGTGPTTTERDERQAGPVALTIEEIDRRLAVWETSEPEAYRYTIDSTCACDWGGSFEVTVRSGEVATVTSMDSATSEEYRDYFAQSVDEMFAMFREAVAIGAEEKTGARASAEFDDQLGHPTEFEVAWSKGGEPYEATVTGFAPEDAADVVVADRRTVPLVISNQSYEHPDVRIEVTVDGETMADSMFPVGDQHSFTTYDLPLEPGRHELVATSDSGARLSEAIEVVDGEPLFLVLDHWTTEEPGQEPTHFGFTQSDEPPMFA